MLGTPNRVLEILQDLKDEGNEPLGIAALDRCVSLRFLRSCQICLRILRHGITSKGKATTLRDVGAALRGRPGRPYGPLASSMRRSARDPQRGQESRCGLDPHQER